jgi:hypothetical protein
MELRILCCCALLGPLAFAAGQGQTGPGRAASASDIPHLRPQGTATQLIVDGKPFLALAGELLNNSATGIEHMKPIWPKLVASKFNTILAGVSWAQIEPVEGKFDFKIVDGTIEGARVHGLRLVLLWFGSWKNSLSS